MKQIKTINKYALLLLMLVGAGTTAWAEENTKVLTVDFEKDITVAANYAEWNFYKLSSNGSSITPHNESSQKYGFTIDSSTNSKAYVQTNEKVCPVSLTCYISKQTDNTNASSFWYIQVSADGTNWIKINKTSATDMQKGQWKEFTADLSCFYNVYVCVYYSGSSAVRCIDDISLTVKDTGETGTFDFPVTISSACTDGTKYYGTFSFPYSFTVPSDVTVSEVGVVNGKLQVEDYAPGAVVPANTGVMISSATAGEKTFTSTTGGTSVLGDNNKLRPTTNVGISSTEMASAAPSCQYYRLTMHNGTIIGYWWGAEAGVSFDYVTPNRAYLAVPTSGARQSFAFDDDANAIGDVNVEATGDDRCFDLQGRSVAQPQKGLYIVNGKKIVR